MQRAQQPGAMAMAVGATIGAVTLGSIALVRWRSKAKAIEAVPKRMKRVVLVEANRELSQARLEVQEVDTPRPRPGQVLVKVAAAPVNPSDDGVWLVIPRQGYPMPLGNEGAGKVVATGGGFLASRYLGKNVAITGNTYAEYTVADASQSVFSLPDDLPPEEGCAFFINPFSVVGMVDTVKEHRGKAFIHTAASSQLGQMMVKYCKKEGVTLVNIVRRQEQVELLRSLGADYIVSTGESDWRSKLAELIKSLNIKHAFDAVAGNMSSTLLALLPPGSTVWVYGRLAPEPVGNIQPLDLIYRGKKLEGWILSGWLTKGGLLKALIRGIRTGAKVRKHLKDVFASDFKDTSLQNIHKDYCALKAKGVTGTKMRVCPHIV
mmetsp:Transcript_44245/g.99751  ORF Transcript_44245/g.99751 Transcript_44245/m.99751 type:complete len:377 (+) Transcript_44245:55-1185(+)